MALSPLSSHTVHRGNSLRVLGGSRGTVSSMDGHALPGRLPELSNFYCLPGRAGGSPLAIRLRSIAWDADILFSGPFDGLFRSFVIKQPITFHHVQSFGVWRAVHVDHGKRPACLDAHGVYYQRVAFIMAHGIPIPRGRHLRRMRLVHAHAADFMILGVQDGDLMGLLQQLNSKISKNVGHGFGPTLVVWSRVR